MPSYHDSTGLYVSGTAAAVPKPAVANGEHVLVIATGRQSASITTPPADFSEIFHTTSGSGTGHIRAVGWIKHVTNAGSEPATYDVTWGASAFGDHFAVSFSGADVVDPINVFDAVIDAGADAAVSSPSVTTTVDACLLLRLASMSRDGGIASGSWSTTDATKVEDPGTAINANHKVGTALAHETAGDAGATGAEAWTVSAASFGIALGITLAIQAAVPTAAAGGDQNANPGQLVILDGSGSTNSTTWTWAQTLGTPDVSDYLIPGIGVDAPEASFYAPIGPTTLTFELEVGDGVTTDTDTMTVTVSGAAPGAPLIPKVNDGGVWV
jgi:hypothetical protein